jgi:hypothetical protein
MARHRRGSAAFAALAAFAAVVAPVVGGARLAAATADLRVETSARYVVDVGASVVHVTVDATVTNETAPEVADGVERRTFFPEVAIPVLSEAREVAASTAGGTALPVRVETAARSSSVKFAVVDLAPDVFPGESQSFRLSYELPNLAPRSDGFTRVTPAFVTFAAFAVGDPGLTAVEVLVPEGFAVEHTGSEVTEQTRDGYRVLSAAAIDAPTEWSLLVVARNDAQLATRALDVGGRELVIRSYPDDPEWSGFVEGTLRAALGPMEELVGLPWPVDGVLTVREAASPYIYGYAGWYSPSASTIEVGDRLDARAILHEVSHVWFNRSLFATRWINEGFAEELAASTLAAVGETAPTPAPIAPDDPGAVALSAWGDPELTSETVDARELYGYNASFAVVHDVATEIGAGRLRRVIAAAADREIAYGGDPPREAHPGDVDSRRLLDLFEEVGGSTRAGELFARHVFTPDEAVVLVARAAARARYGELVDAGGGWTAPLAVRRALAAWEFDDAVALADRAAAVLAARDDVADAASALGLAMPPSFEDAYESADDLGGVEDTAAQLGRAARAIARAEAAVRDEPTPWERVGRWWAGAGDALDDARAAFEAGDGAAAIEHAARAESIVEGAAASGARRIAAALVVVLAAVVAGLVARARRRAPGPGAGSAG